VCDFSKSEFKFHFGKNISKVIGRRGKGIWIAPGKSFQKWIFLAIYKNTKNQNTLITLSNFLFRNAKSAFLKK